MIFMQCNKIVQYYTLWLFIFAQKQIGCFTDMEAEGQRAAFKSPYEYNEGIRDKKS